MWCALNCQAYGTPPYYPLFVVFLPEASSLASIGPLYSAFLWVLQYPSSILRSSCRLVSVKRDAEEQIFLFVRNRSRPLLAIQNRSVSLFWEEERGGGGQTQQVSHDDIKPLAVDTVMRKPPPSSGVERLRWQRIHPGL